jgi:hypothetical protein
MFHVLLSPSFVFGFTSVLPLSFSLFANTLLCNFAGYSMVASFFLGANDICCIHYQVSCPVKQLSLQRLCEEIRQHFFSCTIFHHNFLFVNSILNEEIPNVNVSCSFTTGTSSVPFQQNGNPVVLIQYIVVYVQTLVFEEIPCPYHLW